MYDLLLSGGLTITERGQRREDIAVKDGRIAAIFEPGRAPSNSALRVIDCSGLYVVPGIIDPHAHLGIYQPTSEDFARDTSAAAIGGVTTVVNYFKSNDDYPDVLDAVIEESARSSVIDFALSLMLIRDAHLEQLPVISRDYGINSFKFLSQHKGTYKATSGIPDAMALDDWSFVRTLRALADLDSFTTLCMHCENMELARPITAQAMAGGSTMREFGASSPGFVEASDLLRFAHLAKIYGGHVYAVHLSSAASVAVLPALQDMLAGSEGTLSVETTPHYLSLTGSKAENAYGKVGPPLREEEDQEALWSALAKGMVHTIGSDHVPSMLPVRTSAGSGAWETKLGFAGIGVMLPVALEFGFHRRGIPLETVIAALTWNSARRFGLYPRKGTLSVGSDADVVVLDLKEERTITAGGQELPEDHTPYEGLRLRGWPRFTISRGDVIVEKGRMAASVGRGQYLNRND